MRCQHGFAALLLAVAPLVAAPPAFAETVTITGTAGTAGADGADGNPGADGAPGGEGQSVEAVADAGEDNQATAFGGRGGSGGDGGDGVPEGADSGTGGQGGSGGDATARAIGTGVSSAIATAVGGPGGIGGRHGGATAPGVDPEFGVGGGGGDAWAEATVDAAGAGDGAVAATASATATTNDPGSGNDAKAIARATTDGGGAVTVSAVADGNGADLSTSTATAYGSNAGSAPAIVEALASNFALDFSGGYPRVLNLPGGNLSATAEGHSTGGGDVTVIAAVHRSNSLLSLEDPSTSLHDAVSGSTSGRLTLRQLVNLTFFGPPAAGDAITSLNATNPGGGALSVDIFARGGPGNDAVLGDILATSDTGADVDIRARASGGLFGGTVLLENRSPGSSPTPSRIHADSNGGDVSTVVDFAGGFGYRFFSFGDPDPRDHPDGSSIEMMDVASGDTTGALSLEQIARGGSGYAAYADSPAGSGGSARSALTKHTASVALELRATATAGNTGNGNPSPDRPGADAAAFVEGSNSAGAARVFARAEGGSGGAFASGRGGNAVTEAAASTTGDGHEVVVGEEIPVFGPGGSRFPLALGGAGGVCSRLPTSPCPSGLTLPAGGDASSRSTGTAAGDSRVTVFDLAIGGAGGGLFSRGGFVGLDATGGAGGAASSTAIATGGGASAVKAKSEAHGGAGGTGVTSPGHGGDADAFATAAGLAQVEAWARAIGADSGFFPFSGPVAPFGPAGSATAHASADGASGFARAEASTGRGAGAQLRAQSEAIVGSRRDVFATATHGAALASAPSDPDLEGMAFFTGAPLEADVDTARAGNTVLDALFADESTAMLALARWQGRSDGDSLVLATELELVLTEADATHKVVLGAFGASVIGDGFENLSFSLAKNGVALGDPQSFDSEEALMAYFAGTVLDLGPGWQAGDELLAHFDLALGGAGTSFAIGLAFATAVPEPCTGLLLAFGLIALTRRRRRGRFSA